MNPSTGHTAKTTERPTSVRVCCQEKKFIVNGKRRTVICHLMTNVHNFFCQKCYTDISENVSFLAFI